jgi:histidinol-phosphate/aromatic aminotransferase/cobyric acid decarboxylase-like protein
MVLIDEAYTEYAGLESLASLAITNPNIVVAKTFSKIYGLAGARVGYAIAHPGMIQQLASYQPWANVSVSVVSVAAAMASLDDEKFVTSTLAKYSGGKKNVHGKHLANYHLNLFPVIPILCCSISIPLKRILLKKWKPTISLFKAGIISMENGAG